MNEEMIMIFRSYVERGRYCVLLRPSLDRRARYTHGAWIRRNHMHVLLLRRQHF